jgi:serine/threonine protein kinase
VSVLEVHPDYGNFAAVIVSELVDGEPLSALRDHPQLSLDYIISIGLQLCDALGYMHDQGLIHREVRPRNILVSSPPASPATPIPRLMRSRELAPSLAISPTPRRNCSKAVAISAPTCTPWALFFMN